MTNKTKCKHYWHNPHVIYEGLTKDGVGVVRYCTKCDKVQMAFTNRWQKPPKRYEVADMNFEEIKNL